jgi:hypothetical protein
MTITRNIQLEQTGIKHTEDLILPFGVTLSTASEVAFVFNGHRASYMSVEDYYRDWEDDWLSEEEKKLAIENDHVWHIHWCPITPISSYKILCYSLEKGIKELGRIDKERYD